MANVTKQPEASAMQQIEGLTLARSVLAWWEEHEHDTISLGDEEEDNAFDETPDFVAKARAYIQRHG